LPNSPRPFTPPRRRKRGCLSAALAGRHALHMTTEVNMTTLVVVAGRLRIATEDD
jgi:hypothetical protein